MKKKQTKSHQPQQIDLAPDAVPGEFAKAPDGQISKEQLEAATKYSTKLAAVAVYNYMHGVIEYKLANPVSDEEREALAKHGPKLCAEWRKKIPAEGTGYCMTIVEDMLFLVMSLKVHDGKEKVNVPIFECLARNVTHNFYSLANAAKLFYMQTYAQNPKIGKHTVKCFGSHMPHLNINAGTGVHLCLSDDYPLRIGPLLFYSDKELNIIEFDDGKAIVDWIQEQNKLGEEELNKIMLPTAATTRALGLKTDHFIEPTNLVPAEGSSSDEEK